VSSKIQVLGNYCDLYVGIVVVPRMTPILRNRHEKVQEASINLIGRIGVSLSDIAFTAPDSSLEQLIVAPNLCPHGNG
jgi:hypothetical protein